MAIEKEFIPVDYDYFDWKGKNYMKIFGKTSEGEKVCVFDTAPVYFYAILDDSLKDTNDYKVKKKIEKLKKKIKEIEVEKKGRVSKVEDIKLEDKKFLGEDVKALKIFATNYKDLHDIADKLDMEEIKKRRGYDLGFVSHYIMEREMKPLHWYKLHGEVLNNSEEFGGLDMSLDVDQCIYLEDFDSVEDSGKENNNFSPSVLAYDIETNEVEIGGGEIVMLSLVSENYKKVISWKKPSSNSNKDNKKKKEYEEYAEFVELVENEKELLERFIEEVRRISPDFFVGYFSDGFDLPYIKARCQKNNIKLSLSLDGNQPRFNRSGSSGIIGRLAGIVHVDLISFIKSVYSQYMQSETLSLNEVSKEFLGDVKTDFNIKHSSELEDDEIEKYYEYNLQDSVLTYKLFEKFWPDIMEFTRVLQEPVFEVTRNGMSRNVEDYILHNLKEFNEIPEKRPNYNEIQERRAQGKYEGAFVFEPTPGLYEDIAMYDFTSSYGSVIVTYNLSKSTHVPDEELEKLEEREKEKLHHINTAGKEVYFSKEEGFFPKMLKEIIQKRKEFKKELKTAKKKDSTDSPEYAVKKARSNAFKLLANASYGYQGFFGARYYSREAAAATAAFAKKSIKDAIEKIDNAGYKTIYSDSVDGKTKVIVKTGDKICEENIENLFVKNQEKSYGKEYDFKNNVEVLTIDNNGNSVFKPLNYVMRHKSGKKMYRVYFTNYWYIDVTEDHSLIGYQSVHHNQKSECKKNPLKRLNQIKPEEIHKKANSIVTLKKIPNEKTKNRNYPKEVYEFAGYFIGDGSFMTNKYGKNYYLRISAGEDVEEIKEKLLNPLKSKGYIKSTWEREKGDITLNGLKLVNIICNDFMKGRKKIFPNWLFEEKKENIASFLRGLFSADGTVMLRNNRPIIKFTSINEEHIKEIRRLLYLVGISHSVFKDNTENTYKDGLKTYSNGSHSKNIIIKNKRGFSEVVGFILERKDKLAKIKSKSLKKKLTSQYQFDIQNIKEVKEIKKPKYVYDLEVEDAHRFFANYVLAHNTDSIAFLSKEVSKKKIEEFLTKVNSELPGIMELELEGFFKRGIWVTTRTGNIGAKKKYALIDEGGSIKIRGFETVRRDWCNLAREVQNEVIKLILQDGNEKRALDYFKSVIDKVRKREVEKEKLTIKTQLKKPLSEYKATGPHVVAAKKMEEKDIPIGQGKLIEYYVAEQSFEEKNKNSSGKGKSKKDALVRERVKLPQEEGKYDIEYYLKNQLLPAVENIFEVLDVNIEEVIEGKKQGKLDKWF